MKKYEEQILQLTPLQYKVTQESATERPFSNKYNDEFDKVSLNNLFKQFLYILKIAGIDL